MKYIKTVTDQNCEKLQCNASNTTLRAWVKPAVKRLALKEALAGSPNGTKDGGGNPFHSS